MKLVDFGHDILVVIYYAIRYLFLLVNGLLCVSTLTLS